MDEQKEKKEAEQLAIGKELELKKAAIWEYRIQKEFEALMTDYLRSNHRRKIQRITKAFHFAKQAHIDGKRVGGDPYIMHPLAVARIVCEEMGLGSTSICTALLHDVVEDTDYEVKDIVELFDKKIGDLVDGLTKISGGVFGKKASLQADNLRRLLLTMSDDIRVILIKIADRLHNMRTLGPMRTDKQYKIAGETMFIYAPLAHRLGLFTIKSELEDLCFKYEHPEDFRLINEKLFHSEKSRQRLFDNFAKPVRRELQKLDITYEMKNRVKSVYSIWNKMNRKGVPFEDIYDIFAVRIIFEPTGDAGEMDEKNLCWRIYTAITSIYRSRQDRLRDWVNHPKANGYQGLHLTVMGPDGQWIEIQIRSKRMDEIDEKGFAAHWKYKEQGNNEESQLEKWLQTITEILEHPSPNSLDLLDKIKLTLFSSEIFVFTPKGDMKTLPKGATSLDFAYSLHTNIGNNCIGAKVNHNLVSLSHKLESGDQVEIITSKSQRPQIEWLNYATTAQAQTKIEAMLRRERKEQAAKGKEKVMEAFDKLSVEPTQALLDKLANHFGFPNKREDFYYAVEKGELAMPDNLRKILKEKSANPIIGGIIKIFGGRKAPGIDEPSPPQTENKAVFDKSKPYELHEDSLGHRNYSIADCCKPVSGDNVFGFIDDDDTVIVHKHTCVDGARLKSNFGGRILSVVWSSHVNTSFEAQLKVTGIDAIGMLMEIAKTISSYNVNIIRLLIEVNDGVFEGKINMQVHNVEDIQNMSLSLSKINNINSVSRVDL